VKRATFASPRCGTYYECVSPTTPPPTPCPVGQFWNGTSCITSGITPSSCDAALKNLLGSDCHHMYSDPAGLPIFCDGPMTVSAKRGDTAVTQGCHPPQGGGG
jgi:hypothetical protein